MNPRPSLVGRAILAVALMVCFYVLALSIAGGLLWLPWAEWHYGNRIHPKLAIMAIVGAGVILWSVLPRFDKFEPPGPTLDEGTHPALFRAIHEAAGATQQAMPAEVYLVPDMNAFVTQRGGIMGFGSRRVMGLGLPLLQLLTVGELRAVLAHEFGHFHGGDTKLGPWIYKTRAAIGRTLQGLHASGRTWIAKPFDWYGRLFLRITQAISRRQELAADSLAAGSFGAGHLASGLRKVHSGAMAFAPYWQGEVAPVVDGGFLPPLAAGFQRFITTAHVSAAMEEGVAAELASGEVDPYDTHPPLRQRLQALGNPQVTATDEPLAITLLHDVPAAERALVRHLAGDAGEKLVAVDWEDIGPKLYQPAWEERVGKEASKLAGMTVDGLGEHVAALSRLVESLGDELPPEAREDAAAWLLAAAGTAALARHGWSVRALPGENVMVEKDGTSLDLFAVIKDLRASELTPQAWRERCQSLGLTGIPLAPGR